MSSADSLDDRIVECYVGGATMVQVSERTGASMRRVRRVLHEREVPIRVGGTKKFDLPVEEIAALYRQGLTCEEVGRRFGVSANTIHDRLREHGIETRRVGPRVGWYERRKQD